MDYNRKIDFAIKLLRSIPQDGTIELSYSGGKDSDVILELAKMAGIPFEAIYKNTTIDPPGTIKHCRDNGVKVVQPKETFFKLVEKSGLPNRWRRFCCEHLKEYKIHDRAIQGIRREESRKRAERYKEPEYCRTYKKGENVRIYLPILEWTLDDVQRFIEDRKIKLAPAYYDDKGECHYDRRLGCLGCPLASIKHRRESFLKYPGMLRAYINAGKTFMINHTESIITRKNRDIYEKMFKDLFFDTVKEAEDYLDCEIFPLDTKAFLESYFGIAL